MRASRSPCFFSCSCFVSSKQAINRFFFSFDFYPFVLCFLDLPGQAAAHEGNLPPHQRAALAVAADEVGHRRGHDPRRPLERFQPAVRDVRSGKYVWCFKYTPFYEKKACSL